VSVRLVMLGPPGAGKGTQAATFARRRGIPWISTGEMLRQASAASKELGRARVLMDAGQLVDDETTIGMVRERLAQPDASRGFVLDGFPRTLVQAEALDDLLDGRHPLVVVDIEVPDETLSRRLETRAMCPSCGTPGHVDMRTCGRCGASLVQRRDDEADVVRKRLRVYEERTRPIVEFYRRRPTFRSVDGDQPADAVSADIASAVASVVGGP